MNSKISLKIIHQDFDARRGDLITSRGQVPLPFFCPVATKGSVKSLDAQDLKNLEVKMILANAYHLHLRPGDQLIKKRGGLHQFMNFNSPILTDSGGFQVFSLSSINKIQEEGVEFRDHIDGRLIFMTAQKSIEIQYNLGADIIMAFDHCPTGSVSKKESLESVQRTFNWLKESKSTWESLKNQNEFHPSLFGIVQGAMYPDLRLQSLEQVESLDLPGVAVGGMSVGEPKEKMYEILKFIGSKLPKNKPRYLMGVGSPEDLIFAVDCGFDLFDCVLPTRTARTGGIWTKYGMIQIRNQKYKEDPCPIEEDCLCFCCQNYSKSYLRHLFSSKELLGYRLATIHNTHFYMTLMKNIRKAIETSCWSSFKNQTLDSLRQKN